MNVENKEQIQEKLDQSRRLLQQASDPTTVDRLRSYIEELEARLLMMMGHGPQA
jgi:DNA-binding ferritin-like protein